MRNLGSSMGQSLRNLGTSAVRTLSIIYVPAAPGTAGAAGAAVGEAGVKTLTSRLTPFVAAGLSLLVDASVLSLIVASLALPWYAVPVSTSAGGKFTLYFGGTDYYGSGCSGASSSGCSSSHVTYASVAGASCSGLSQEKCSALQAAGDFGARNGSAGIAMLVLALFAMLYGTVTAAMSILRTRGLIKPGCGGRFLPAIISPAARLASSGVAFLLIAAGVGLSAQAALTVEAGVAGNSPSSGGTGTTDYSYGTPAAEPGLGMGVLAVMVAVPAVLLDCLAVVGAYCPARLQGAQPAAPAGPPAGSTPMLVDSEGRVHGTVTSQGPPGSPMMFVLNSPSSMQTIAGMGASAATDASTSANVSVNPFNAALQAQAAAMSGASASPTSPPPIYASSLHSVKEIG